MSYRAEDQDRKVLAFVKDFHAEHGYAPTVREVCDAIDASSTSTGHARIMRLIREGKLRNSPGVVRSLTLGPEALGVPLGGTAEL